MMQIVMYSTHTCTWSCNTQ